MKNKFILSLFFLGASFLGLKAQNFSQSNVQQPTCFGACNGSVTFTTSSVNGPFNAVLTNSASCPNSTVSSSTGSAITINSVCACASTYTVAIYTGTILAGVDYVQFPNYATAPLTVSTQTVNAASCSTCCNGSASFTWSGGNTTFTNTPPMFILDGAPTSSYSPAPNLCVGSHTICAKDSSQCYACKTFTVAFNVTTGISQNLVNTHVNLFPNPVSTDLSIEVGQGGSIAKVVIIDPMGRIAMEHRSDIAAQNKIQINVSPLAEGLYMIEVYGIESRTVHRSRFAKKDN